MKTSSPPVQIARHLKDMPPYTPIEPFEVLSARLGRDPQEIVKLDANENPYGPSAHVRQALAELVFPHIYPDPESRALRAALAEFSGLPQENLLAGSGADELIDLVLRVVLEPQERVLVCPPTFSMYAFDTRLNAGQVLEVRRMGDFSLDLDAIHVVVAEQRPKVLFLTSPNNPDGSLLPRETLEDLLKLPLLVVLDEAYIEFSGLGRLGEAATRLRDVPERDNLIVLRTFSKWAGLAGLRVGYGAFPDWLMPILWKAKQPYNVNVAASTAAIASLQDLEVLAANVERLRSERTHLMAALKEISFLIPYPSQANFILCRVTGVDAAALKNELAIRYGILVRYFNSPGLQDHIRISVGRPEDTDRLLEALKTWEMDPGMETRITGGND
jgi:histidinol-phosphate aminotransferase